jgi:hypothetical protein
MMHASTNPRNRDRAELRRRVLDVLAAFDATTATEVRDEHARMLGSLADAIVEVVSRDEVRA